MKAIVSHSYGSYQNLQLVTDFAKPSCMLKSTSNGTTINKIPKGKLLVKTEAVSLAPGDVRVLSGACKEFQGPPSFPYIPGGDLCGIVMDMHEDIDPSVVGYKVGDRVAARFTEGPRGALAEYALVSTKMTDKVPENLTSEDAAALASSGTIALCLSQRISPKERVVIMGAGGGVGSHLCQILRIKGVKCIAVASHDPDRMLQEPFCCDFAMNYESKDVYDFQEWKTIMETKTKTSGGDGGGGSVHAPEQFDTIVDLAGGGWLRLLEKQQQQQEHNNMTRMIVKSAKEGGRYLTLVPDKHIYELHNIWQGLKLLLFRNLYRAFYSRTMGQAKLPAYTFAMSLDNRVEIMKETLQLASENKLKACVDDRGPFDFTTEGAQAAFQLQESRRVRGKVVIRTAAANSTHQEG